MVGNVDAQSFKVRRSRGWMTPPRVEVMHGTIQADGSRSLVRVRYSPRGLVRLARAVWVLMFVAFALVVIPGASQRPELLWIPVVIGLVVGLMLLPFAWLGSEDRRALELELESALGRCGRVERTSPK